MKLTDYRNDYYALSGKASDVARQLALAGIAVVWIFKNERGGPLAVPKELLVPAALFVVTLALDLFQYVLSTIIWGFFSRHHERKGIAADAELSAPKYFNWPALACFWGKLLSVLLGYCLAFAFISTKIAEP